MHANVNIVVALYFGLFMWILKSAVDTYVSFSTWDRPEIRHTRLYNWARRIGSLATLLTLVSIFVTLGSNHATLILTY